MKWFKKGKKKDTSPRSEAVTRGLLIFADTSTVMHAEQILKEENYDIRVVSPPPQYRTGCDLSIEFPMVEAEDRLGANRRIACIRRWVEAFTFVQDQRLWPIPYGQGSQYEDYRG
jgi:hypothetical protein